MQAIDKDGDGYLDRGEFLTFSRSVKYFDLQYVFQYILLFAIHCILKVSEEQTYFILYLKDTLFKAYWNF